VTEEVLGRYLSTGTMPDRTGHPDGGRPAHLELLLWQAAYAELYFTDAFGPISGARTSI